MDTSTLVLAVLVAVSVIGQAGLILWCQWRTDARNKQVAKARADLLEAAADRQLHTNCSLLAKLDRKGGGNE